MAETIGKVTVVCPGCGALLEMRVVAGSPETVSLDSGEVVRVMVDVECDHVCPGPPCGGGEPLPVAA